VSFVSHALATLEDLAVTHSHGFPGNVEVISNRIVTMIYEYYFGVILMLLHPALNMLRERLMYMKRGMNIMPF
jgi:hypothetical protein